MVCKRNGCRGSRDVMAYGRKSARQEVARDARKSRRRLVCALITYHHVLGFANQLRPPSSNSQTCPSLANPDVSLVFFAPKFASSAIGRIINSCACSIISFVSGESTQVELHLVKVALRAWINHHHQSWCARIS